MPCRGCKLRGRFDDCAGSMNIKLLMSVVGIGLLLFRDPDSELHNEVATTTEDSDILDEEMKKLYHNWSSRIKADKEDEPVRKKRRNDEDLDDCEGNGCIDMTTKGKQPAKDWAEKQERNIQALFRDQVQKLSLKDVGIFSNLFPGPQIAYADSPFGRNLEHILNEDPSANKTQTLLRAFNAFNVENPDVDSWRTQIASTRRENDLVMVLGGYSHVVQVEVKSGTNADKAIKQIENFHNYMKKFHGPFLNNFNFISIVAKPRNTQVNLCDDCLLNIETTSQGFDSWWHNTFMKMLEAEHTTTTTEECKSLVERLLMISSLVLTSLPPLTRDYSDINLILLRESQWNFLSARPPFAVIYGNQGTGKSTALELGLAFVNPGGKMSRYVVSFDQPNLVQNMIRKKFFENTGISLFCSENETEISGGILEKVLKDVQDKESKQQHQEAIICIDNIELKDLLNPDILKQLVLLKKKSKYIWIVLEDTTCEEEPTWKSDLEEKCRKEELVPTVLFFK